MKAGDYDQLRSLARWVHDGFRYTLPFEGAVYKSLDSMDRGDNALATAFVDYLLDTNRARLVELLKQADGETPVTDVVKDLFGDPIEADKAFTAWFVRNY